MYRVCPNRNQPVATALVPTNHMHATTNRVKIVSTKKSLRPGYLARFGFNRALLTEKLQHISSRRAGFAAGHFAAGSPVLHAHPWKYNDLSTAPLPSSRLFGRLAPRLDAKFEDRSHGCPPLACGGCPLVRPATRSAILSDSYSLKYESPSAPKD